MEPLFAAHRRRRFQPTRRAACTAADRSVQLTEEKFLRITEGSAIRRIGHLRWLRNIAVALGNAPYEDGIVLALRTRLGQDAMLDEHIHWALAQQLARREAQGIEVQTAQKNG